MSQEDQFWDAELAFIYVYLQFVLIETWEYCLKMLLMFYLWRGSDENVIQVDEDEVQVT